MSTRLRFLGAAGFEVVGPDSRVLIDPFLTGNPVAPMRHEELETPDLILVTHGAYDHLGDTAAIARRTGAPVVCGGDVRQLLLDDGVPATQIEATIWGVVVRVAGIDVRPVECHHWSMSERRNGQIITGTPLAFIFEPEPGVRVYHYGDTSVFDMRLIGELYRPTVGLIGCSQPRGLAGETPSAGVELTGELDPNEAALVSEMLGVRTAVACHYTEPGEDAERFLALVAERNPDGACCGLAPSAGEWITLEPDLALKAAGA